MSGLGGRWVCRSIALSGGGALEVMSMGVIIGCVKVILICHGRDFFGKFTNLLSESTWASLMVILGSVCGFIVDCSD